MGKVLQENLQRESASRLSSDHVKYFIIRRYLEKARIIDIYEELTDVDAKAKYGIATLPNLSKTYFYKRVSRIDKEDVAVVRTKWMEEIVEVPIASKRYRLEQLNKLLLNDINVTEKVKVIRQAQLEVGEEDWIDALKESNKTNINVLGGVTIDIIKQIASSIVNDLPTEDSLEEIEE